MRTEQQATSPDGAIFVLLSFEGPDRYSLAGGLGVRVTELSQTLASLGYRTHLFFVGDPREKDTESLLDGKLTLHRWCQWISKYYPDGVYQGEEEKLYDFNDSLPWYILEHIARPAAAEDKTVVILGEEWHTAEAMCRISDLLYYNGLRNQALQLWNANNTMSFHRINWGRLTYTNTVTTVSRYMKHIMWGIGVNPLVIPNGIPARLLEEVDADVVARLRRLADGKMLLFKVGRFDPDKRWNMAVEAVARLKMMGHSSLLITRGGIEPHGGEVMQNARSMGLMVKDVRAAGESPDACIGALEAALPADILNLRFFVPPWLLRGFYRSADGVLANSGHEPFGLVGLEAMAAGGVAFTGSTGEDYAIPLDNAVVLETDDPAEIADYCLYLQSRPEVAESIRAEGKRTARHFRWEEVVGNLMSKLGYLAQRQGLSWRPELPREMGRLAEEANRDREREQAVLGE